MAASSRAGKRNEPVDYFATTFKAHKSIEAENKPRMVELVKEINETVGIKFADKYVPPSDTGSDYPEEDISPDDIPFYGQQKRRHFRGFLG